MMMRLALSALLIAHGVAHLVGFAVPWRLVATPDVPYRTTVLAATVVVGAAGVRIIGIAWLLAAMAFVLLGSAVLAGWSVRSPLFTLVGVSLVLCAIGWPDTRIGIGVNLLLLLLLRYLPS